MSKVGTPKITGSVLTAAQHSPFLQQSERIIPNTGGTLIIDDIIQFGRGIISYTTIGSFFQDDSTIANTIVLNQQGDFDTPQDAVETWNGMLIRFRPKFANTGNATVNLAGLNGGTPINIVNESGVALSAGELSTNRDAFLRYDLANTRFILLNSTLQSAVETLQSQVIPATTTTQGIAYLNKPITLSYNSTTVIDYSAGTFQFDDGSDSGVLSAGSIDLATNGIGGLDTGSLAINTTYFQHAYKNDTTGAFGTAMSTSPTSSTISGWTRVARIRGAVLITNGSSEIIQGTWYKNGKFEYNVSILGINNANQAADTETLRTLPVPLNIKTEIFGSFKAFINGATSAAIFKIYSANQTLTVLNAANGSCYASAQVTVGQAPFCAITNTFGQVKTNRLNTVNNNSANISISVDGWIDNID